MPAVHDVLWGSIVLRSDSYQKNVHWLLADMLQKRCRREDATPHKEVLASSLRHMPFRLNNYRLFVLVTLGLAGLHRQLASPQKPSLTLAPAGHTPHLLMMKASAIEPKRPFMIHPVLFFAAFFLVPRSLDGFLKGSLDGKRIELCNAFDG